MAFISKKELIKYQKTLKSDAAIAKKFNVTRQAVHQLRVRYGIAANLTKNKKRNEKILELYEKGLTGIRIAQRYDLCISQVYRIIKKNA